MTRRARPRPARGDDWVTCGFCGRAFSVVNWMHLTRVHDLDPLTAVDEYKRRFGERSTLSAALRRKLKRIVRHRLRAEGRLWSKARMRRLLKEHSVEGVVMPSKFKSPWRYEITMNLAANIFGGRQAALKACGLRSVHHSATQWTKAEVLRRIRERQRRGLSLLEGDVQREDNGLYRFGPQLMGKSWNMILQDLGLHGIRHRWTRGEILSELLYWRRHGRVRSEHVTPSKLSDIARWHFGSLSKALRAAKSI